MKRQRGARLSSEYKKAIYEILSEKLKDGELTEMFSVLKCDVAADLKHAKVYISVFSKDEQKRKTSFLAIERAAGFVRHELAKIMQTRTVPEIHFFLDDSLEYGDKIDKLLNQIKGDNL